jgi:hypothetical protein
MTSLVRQLAALMSSTVVFVFNASRKRLSPGRIVYLTQPAGAPHVGVGETEVGEGPGVSVSCRRALAVPTRGVLVDTSEEAVIESDVGGRTFANVGTALGVGVMAGYTQADR